MYKNVYGKTPPRFLSLDVKRPCFVVIYQQYLYSSVLKKVISFEQIGYFCKFSLFVCQFPTIFCYPDPFQEAEPDPPKRKGSEHNSMFLSPPTQVSRFGSECRFRREFWFLRTLELDIRQVRVRNDDLADKSNIYKKKRK